MLKEEVYKKLKEIPRGKIITYKELAKSVNSKAYRTIGTILKTNIDLKNIPCYKVIKSDGGIGKYQKGIKNKIKLLKRDGIKIKNNKIDLKKYLYKMK